jgi:hypothetical protein
MQPASSTTKLSRRCVLGHTCCELGVLANIATAHQALEQNADPRGPAAIHQWRHSPRLASFLAVQQSCLLLQTGTRTGEGQ